MFAKGFFMDLATYASDANISRGRLYPDFTNIIRSPFQRDRDRLIHSRAFRKLDGKTQVFAYHEGKNYRTRLTHSIEVAQITRTICKHLKLNEELGEAVALAHDLGHSPFGHAGERALQNAMKKYGGFDHNIHSLKIMTKLEVKYPEFEGLNLTWETLEGTTKHNGPIKKVTNNYLKSFNQKFDLDLKNYPSLEGQVGAIADDIAYNNHDIDDGFNAGFFSINQLRELPFINKIASDFEDKYPHADDNLKIYNITRNTIGLMVFDVLENTKNNILKYNIKTPNDARKQKCFTVDFSDKMKQDLKLLRKFLTTNFYTHTNVARMDEKSQKVTEGLFKAFSENTKLLPMKIRKNLSNNSKDQDIADTVCEYIAGMTDMGAIEEYNRIFDINMRF